MVVLSLRLKIINWKLLLVIDREEVRMNEIKEYKENLFEDIKHTDEDGNEFWLARELMPLLEYSK